MTTMLALRGMPGEEEPRLVHTDIPEVGADDVLVRIKSAGMSPGVLRMLRAGRITMLPQTMGHEGAGIVEAVGRDVTNIAPGERVRVHPTLSCGRCRHCLTDRDQMCQRASTMGFLVFGTPVDDWDRYHNGFVAEYALAPAKQVDKLPGNVSFDVGAKLQYFANAIRVLKEADLPMASTLAVLGGTGAMCATLIKMLPMFGVQRLILVGRSTARLTEMAARSGMSTEIVSTEALGEDWFDRGALGERMKEILPEGADAMIDFLPNGQLWQAISGLGKGGTLVHYGVAERPLPVPMAVMVANCWRVVGTRNNSRLDAFEALRFLADGRITGDDIITHHHPLAEAEEVARTLETRNESRWLTVVHP